MIELTEFDKGSTKPDRVLAPSANNKKQLTGKQSVTPEVSDLLKVLIAVTGRGVFSPDQISQIVAPRGRGPYILAYNLCDGATPLAEIARLAKLDRANLHKATLKWIEAGILFRVGPNEMLLHLYSLPPQTRGESLAQTANQAGENTDDV